MATDNPGIVVTSKDIHKFLYRPWTALRTTRNRSDEAAGRDTIRIDDFKTNINISDLPDGHTEDITYQVIDDGTVNLNLEKRRYYAIKMADSQTDLEKPYDTVSEIVRQATISMLQDLDKYLTAKHDDTADVALGNSDKFTVTSKVADWKTAATREAIISAIADVRVEGLKRGWYLQDGSSGPLAPGMPYMWLDPEIWGQILRYYSIDKVLIGSGATNDESVVRGVIRDQLGFMPVVNYSTTGNAAAAGTNQFKVRFGIMNDTLHFAQQYSVPEIMRSPGFPGWLLRGVTRYGAKVRENARRMELNFTFTA